MKKCLFCQEEIQDSAVKCRYCGEWLNKQDKPSSNKDILADKILTPIISFSQQSTIVHPNIERPQEIDTGKKWFRWSVFAVGTGLLLVIYAVWKIYDKSHGGGFVTGVLRGLICVGGIIWLFYWAKDTPSNNLKQSEPNIDNYRTPENISLWNWKSLIIAFFIAFLLNIILAGISNTEPRKNIIWTVWWIYLTIEAWKYWQWKALLPFPIYLFVLMVGGLFLKGVGFEYHSYPVIILLIVTNIGGLVTFYWILSKEIGNKKTETSLSEDAEIEKIIREAKSRPVQGVQKIAQSESEAKQQDDEFIELFKSAINENGLNTIPGNDLIEIYNRANVIAFHSHETDMELSEAINALSEEIKKRGLHKGTKTQKISSFEKSSFTQKYNEQHPIIQVLIAIIAALAIPLIIYILLGIVAKFF